jgi:hypothetical protein
VQLPPDCKLKLASKPSHVKGMQAMCEEDRREVDPSAEWLSRQDLRNDWVRTPFMARCIIRSRSCTWAATPTAGQGRASSRRRRSGNTIPSRPPNGCRALVADAGRETDHPPSDPGYRHLRLFPEAACSDCLHHRRTTAFWLEDGQRFRQRPTRRRISAPAPGAPENVRSGPWRAEAREVAAVEVPRHCDQTHHTRHWASTSATFTPTWRACAHRSSG